MNTIFSGVFGAESCEAKEIVPSSRFPFRRSLSFIFLALLLLFISLVRKGVAVAEEEEKNDRPSTGTPASPASSDESLPPSGRIRIILAGGTGAGRISVKDEEKKGVGVLPGLDFFWGEGTVEIPCPIGWIHVTIRQGPRIEEWQQREKISPGRTTELTAILKDYGEVTSAGWLLCDPYLEIPESFSLSTYPFVTLEAVGMASRAEGLQCVGIAGYHRLYTVNPEGAFLPYGELSHPLERLLADREKLEKKGTVPLFVMDFEASSVGRFFFLEKQPRLSQAKRGEGDGWLQALQQVHERGGLVVAAHPTGVLKDVSTGAVQDASEGWIFSLLTGNGPDALDVGRGGGDLELWQLALSLGYPICGIGGGPLPPSSLSPMEASKPDLPSLGMYLRLPRQRIEPGDVIATLREGRGTISNGPFLTVTIDGCGSGDSLPPGREERLVRIDAIASSLPSDNIGWIELLYNGRVIKRWQGAKKEKQFEVKRYEYFPEEGYVQVKYLSTDPTLWAITNPVYIRKGGILPPPPILLRFRPLFRDAKSKKVVEGWMEVTHGGALLFRSEVNDSPSWFEVPAAAVIRVGAAGYHARRIDLYREGGPWDLMEGYRRDHRLRAALLDRACYEAMASLLRNLKPEILLEPLPPQTTQE